MALVLLIDFCYICRWILIALRDLDLNIRYYFKYTFWTSTNLNNGINIINYTSTLILLIGFCYGVGKY